LNEGRKNAAGTFLEGERGGLVRSEQRRGKIRNQKPLCGTVEEGMGGTVFNWGKRKRKLARSSSS